MALCLMSGFYQKWEGGALPDNAPLTSKLAPGHPEKPKENRRSAIFFSLSLSVSPPFLSGAKARLEPAQSVPTWRRRVDA